MAFRQRTTTPPPPLSPKPQLISGRSSPASEQQQHHASATFDTSNDVSVDLDGNHTQLVSPSSAALNPRRGTEIVRFKVFARARPFIQEELQEMNDGAELRSIVEMNGPSTILLDPTVEPWKPRKTEYVFDNSLWSIPPSQRLVQTVRYPQREKYDTQLDVYNICARGLVEDIFNGFNWCIMTYGQTGSGKTYTMMGKYNPTEACGGEGEEGIIPRVCNDLFARLEEVRQAETSKPEAERIDIHVEVIFVEIYMEKVRDLLDPTIQKKNGEGVETKVRQDSDGAPYVEGVTRYRVENWAHCCQLLERGSRHRKTCATIVHNQSSRSHAIFQLVVIMDEKVAAKDRYSRAGVRRRGGRINLVDLAGSERGGFTDYVKESSKINKSLLALRRVIDQLIERQSVMLEMARQEVEGGNGVTSPVTSPLSLPQVPFRDSVLTWLLSDSIGGNARTTMIATLSPLAKNFVDTHATLEWSSKARSLVTIVKANDPMQLVAGGMTNKANELQLSLLIQRQNVDSLRDALQSKLEYAESLDRETKNLMKQTISCETAAEKASKEHEYASVVIFARRWLQRRMRQRKTIEENETRNQLMIVKENRDKVQAVEDAAAQRLQVAKAAKELQEKEKLALQKKLAGLRSNVKTVEKRKAIAEEQFRSLTTCEDAAERELKAMEEEALALATKHAALKDERQKREKKLVMMDGYLEAKKAEDAMSPQKGPPLPEPLLSAPPPPVEGDPPAAQQQPPPPPPPPVLPSPAMLLEKMKAETETLQKQIEEIRKEKEKLAQKRDALRDELVKEAPPPPQ